MENELRKLPDSELEVMQLVWDLAPPVPRAAIERAMAQRRPMAQTTLLTLLSRLAEKGFLRVEKQGRSSVYTPLVERGAYLATQSRRFIDRLCGGNLSVFASALCDSGLTEEELSELRGLLERGRL